jgi:hypothetical protein
VQPACQDYLVCAKNHVTTNFEGRLRKYLALRVTRALAEPGKRGYQLAAGVDTTAILAWLQPILVGAVGGNLPAGVVDWLKKMPRSARWALADWIADSLVLYTTRPARNELPSLETLLETRRRGVAPLRTYLEEAPLLIGEAVAMELVDDLCWRIYSEQYSRYQDIADLWLRREGNWHRFLPWLYEIQMSFDRCNGTEMCGRRFTILPVCSNKAKYIQLDNGTLRLFVQYHNNTNPVPLQTLAAPENAPQWASYINLKRVMTNVGSLMESMCT